MGFAQTKSVPAADRAAAIRAEQAGQLRAAEDAWRALANAQPNNPEPYMHIGLLEARQENYNEAIPNYRKALALRPDVPGLRMNLGLALFKAGNLRGAIPEFKTLLQSKTTPAADIQRLNILLGMAHYGVAQYPEAVPYLKRAVENDAQNLPLRLALAHSCLWSKQYQCVMDVYHQILTLNAESAEADMLAGEALDEMKDNAGAVAQFQAAEKANPKEPNVHFGLGYLYWTQKRYPEALAEFQEELANDPMHAQSILYLGDTQLQLNKPGEARPLLEKALALDKDSWLANLDLGIIDMDAGRNEIALKELNQAAKLRPEEPNIHWRLARLYRAMGKPEESKAEFEKTRQINKAADEDLFRKIANNRPQAADASDNPKE